MNNYGDDDRAGEEPIGPNAPVRPIEDPPVPVTPIEGNTPKDEMPGEEEPIGGNAPEDELPVGEAPIGGNAPEDELPVEEEPMVGNTPEDELPVDEAPVEDPPADEAPVEEAPVIGRTPEDGVSGEDAPVAEEPVVEDAPAGTAREFVNQLVEKFGDDMDRDLAYMVAVATEAQAEPVSYDDLLLTYFVDRVNQTRDAYLGALGWTQRREVGASGTTVVTCFPPEGE